MLAVRGGGDWRSGVFHWIEALVQATKLEETKTEQRGFGTSAAECGRVALKNKEQRKPEPHAFIRCAHRNVVCLTLASTYLLVFRDV